MDQKVPSEAELSKLKLPELRALATEMGLRGISRMRKPELVEAIAAGGKAEQPARAPKAAAAQEGQEPKEPKEPKEQRSASTETAEKQAPAQGRGRQRRRAASSDEAPQLELPVAKPAEEKEEPQGKTEDPADQRDRRPRREDQQLDVRAAVAEDLQAAKSRRKADQPGEEPTRKVEIELPEGGEPNRSRSRRDRGRRRGRDRQNQQQGSQQDGRQQGQQNQQGQEELVPIAGILDVQSNHGFVRTSGYLPGDNDVYVTLGNIRRWGLRAGDAVVGAVRPAREGERRQQKYNALMRVDSVNGMTVEQAMARREFGKLTPEYPREQLRLETTSKALTPRMIDLVAPIGKGQRGLIVSPPKAGKTMVIQQIAKAIEVNNPDVHLMVVLVDERPEEVTDMRGIVNGEVIASTFDRPAGDHTIVAELAIERAKRLVELGQDVVVLLDSITRLSRAYNLAAPASGRILSGGVDAAALYPPKKFFGAARSLREGGSLTIIASALVETGSKMDEVIFEEFKGTGNMELRLSRQLADRRIFPAIDINASGTRREELLLKPEELAIMWKLRRVLGSLDQQSALELILGKLKETQNNAEFLMLVQKTTPGE